MFDNQQEKSPSPPTEVINHCHQSLRIHCRHKSLPTIDNEIIVHHQSSSNSKKTDCKGDHKCFKIAGELEVSSMQSSQKLSSNSPCQEDDLNNSLVPRGTVGTLDTHSSAEATAVNIAHENCDHRYHLHFYHHGSRCRYLLSNRVCSPPLVLRCK